MEALQLILVLNFLLPLIQAKSLTSDLRFCSNECGPKSNRTKRSQGPLIKGGKLQNYETACSQLQNSADHLRQGYQSYLNATGLESKDLDNLHTLECLKSVTRLVLVDNPSQEDIYSALHEYLWTLKVKIRVDRRNSHKDSQDYIMGICPDLHGAVYEYMLALPLGVTVGHCPLREQISNCGFEDTSHDKQYKSAIIIHFLIKLIEVSLKSICTS